MKTYVLKVENYSRVERLTGANVLDFDFKGEYTDSEIKRELLRFPDIFAYDKCILLNGSGSYHHLTIFPTYLLTNTRYTYVHIDNHTDAYEMSIISCGSFVSKIVRYNKDIHVNFFGVTKLIRSDESFSVVNNPDTVEVYPPSDIPIRTYISIPFYKLKYFLNKLRTNTSVKQVSKYSNNIFRRDLVIEWKDIDEWNGPLKNKDVYISIDLDVLKTHPFCEWRGYLDMDQLECLLKKIKEECNEIIAADICGYEDRDYFGRERDNLTDLMNTFDVLKEII